MISTEMSEILCFIRFVNKCVKMQMCFVNTKDETLKVPKHKHTTEDVSTEAWIRERFEMFNLPPLRKSILINN